MTAATAENRARIAKLATDLEHLGLKTADAVPEAPKTDRARRLTALEKQARHDLGIAVVAIYGNAERIARYVGDNEGGQAVRTKVSSDPRLVYMDDEDAETRGLGYRADLESPFHSVIELARVYVQSEAHGERFKLALDSALLGSTTRARHAWRSFRVEFDMDMLQLLFGQAVEDSGVTVFDKSERDRRLSVRLRQLGRKAQGR